MELAKSVMREIGNKSREFYEFVLPPVDMRVGDSEISIILDMPGFKKADIKLSVSGNILAVYAQKADEEKKGEIVYDQRPRIIDKKIRLPVSIAEDGEITSAKYEEGMLYVNLPLAKKDRDIHIE